MNGHPHWALHQFAGRIRASQIEGACNLLCPADGIEALAIQSHPIPGFRFLAPSIPALTADSATLPEMFARGGDLAAIYAATDGFPFRAQAYWRLTSHPITADGYSVQASCELVAATQTDLLDSRPDMTVSSSLPVQRVFRLIDAASTGFAEIDLTESHRQLTPRDGTGCVLYRLGLAPFSYAEMVFPLDFESSRLELSDSESHRVVKATHHLFAHRLEKGVVLRSRVLGLWMNTETDFQTAAAHYLSFANSDPPLTA